MTESYKNLHQKFTVNLNSVMKTGPTSSPQINQTETGEKVAIKKVPNAFEDLIDAKRIVREIKLLQFFDHENIISLCDIEKPEARTGFEDIYIICDLMETDLHRVIYSRQEVTDEHI